MGALRCFLTVLTHPKHRDQPVQAQILHSPYIQEAAQATLQAMRKSESIVAGSALLTCFSRRVKRESDTDSMFRAFREMYLLHKTNGDIIAMNIAQILGEKLYKAGHSGISRGKDGSGWLFALEEKPPAVSL